MKSYIQKASDRGTANHGWLKANFYFSFANYYNPQHINFGAIRVLNDDVIEGGGGFGTHPHDNMEIITIPLEGELAHKDSMGHQEVIKSGEVQVMSAGTGIQHSEFNHSAEIKINLFQIWIFPREENVTPRYDQKKFEKSARQNVFQKLVAPNTDDGSLMIHQDAWIWMGDFETGKKINYTSQKKGNGIFALVVEGELESELGKLEKRDALGWYNSTIQLTTIKKSTVLLIDVPLEGF